MGNNRFYTADGFCDVMPGMCKFKKESEGKLRELFNTYGYKEIETPGIEYMDVYTDGDFVDAEELYKLVDKKGRLISARYDGTIPAARFAATIMKDVNPPLRLCYIENMYRFDQIGGGKQSEFTQAGVELLGASGSLSEAEVIALAIRACLAIGVNDLQISIGQVKLFEGVMRQLGVSKEQAELIKDAIDSKDLVSLDRIARELMLSDFDKETILMLVELQGGQEVIDKLMARVADEGAIAALKNIAEVLKILDEYGYAKYVTVDFGLLGSLDYYTGMIFKGFTYEVGFPIVSGGRYDNVMKTFGRELESVGFSMSLSLVMTALMRQGTSMPEPKVEVIVGYDNNVEGARAGAIKYAQDLREQGTSVVLDVNNLSHEQLDEFASKNEIDVVVFIDEV